MKKNVFLIFALILSASSYLRAQATVTVVTTGGSTTSYTVNATGGIYFDDDMLIIGASSRNDVVASIPLASVTTISFSPSASIATVQTSKMSLYPNPTRQSITLQGLTDGTHSYVIYSIEGRTVKQGNIQDGVAIDISDLKPALYFIKVDGATLKFIKH